MSSREVTEWMAYFDLEARDHKTAMAGAKAAVTAPPAAIDGQQIRANFRRLVVKPGDKTAPLSKPARKR